MLRKTYNKKLKNGTEYYFFRLRHKNLKRPKDLYAKTVKELNQKIKELIKELDHGVISSGDNFESFFKDWLFDVHCINKKASTTERYDSIYRNYIKNSDISTIKLKDINARDIQAFYASLIPKGKSINSIRSLNKLIAPCIRYAYNNNFIIKDFSKAVVLPSETETNKLKKAPSVKPFTLEEQKKFLGAIKGHELEALFITALNTGMRQGELLALTWKDINFDDSSIEVNKNVKYVCEVTKDSRSSYKMEVQTPKTKGSIRTVNIPNFLVKVLRTYKRSQLEVKLKLGNLYEDNNLVFATPTGTYIDSSNLIRRLRSILKKNNMRSIKFHDLRHTYATRLFELDENPKTVQKLLGHSNISTTLDTYTHVLENVKEKAVSKLDDLYINM